MSNPLESYEKWLRYPQLDETLRQELSQLAGQEDEIADRFWKDLSFGTGGLRGKIGAGTNRMNLYTVSKAARGIARHLLRQSELASCAIGYDSRRGSRTFARLMAAVMAELGVRVHLFDELVPTPILSFAVRYLRCDGGIMITASHNPREYNGIKVYDRSGCQLNDDAAREVAAGIARHQDLVTRLPDYAEFAEKGMIRPIGRDVYDAFHEAVLERSIELPPEELHVVYSPLNGTGNRPVRRMLASLPNIRVSVVPQQENPDGEFPTTPRPNPELPEAMTLSLALTEELGADICIATDPDCDRVGVGVRAEQGVKLLSGNQVGALMFHFICEGLRAKENLPEQPAAATTLVSTPMADEIAADYGVKLYKVLTGFKYIGDIINRLERDGGADRFIFAFEESIGYLIGPYIREKDGVGAAMMVCEMASYYKRQGMTLIDAYQELEARYGVFISRLETLRYEGRKGEELMREKMDALRQMSEIAGLRVLEKTDYLHDETGLPKSNVLRFVLEGGRQAVYRPSGTEPLLKLYLTVRCTSREEGEKDMQTFAARALALAGGPQEAAEEKEEEKAPETTPQDGAES